jgi:hypothetical protein
MLGMNRYATRRTTQRKLTKSLRARAGTPVRKGVVSVVSMMFLILFGSLAGAMAIMSKGNIVTAATHQHVNRAFGAAETGLRLAEARLAEGARRFVVERGEIDQAFAQELWSGSYSGTYGLVDVNPPKSYPDPGTGSIAGVGDALVELHDQDTRITNPTYKSLKGIEDPTFAGSATSSVFAQAALVLGTPANPQTAFQVTYEPLPSGTDIRIKVTGYDFTYSRNGKPVERTISQDYRMVKRIDAAVMAPSRIMIGKNVLVDGDLGAVYTDVDKEHGDPLIMKSDFKGLDATLDDWLDALAAGLETNDTNLDNRLAVSHPIESAGIPEIDGKTGKELDVTDDGFVDDFDLFIRRYDANKDGKVVLSAALTAGTPHEGQSAEFVTGSGTSIDDDLGLLLDTGTPDRNRNRIYGYDDVNGDGTWQPKLEEAYDWEAVDPDSLPEDLKKYVYTTPSDRVYVDQVLGYRDGVIDARDAYAKVAGRLMFRVKESDWLANQGAYMSKLSGAIIPKDEGAPINFEVSEDDLPLLTGANFTNSQTALKAIADGQSFNEQIASNLGITPSALATWEKSMNNPMAGAPKYIPLKPDTNKDGLPDNWDTTAYFEKTPFNAPTYADWYYRPVYENMSFKNCIIPTGTNALFINCTFSGVTYIQVYANNEHPNWTLYGKLKLGPSGKPVLDPPRSQYSGAYIPTMLSPTDVPVLMVTVPNNPLDKADIPSNLVPSTVGYDKLPDPLLIDGKRVVDTKLFSNNLRFHDCLIVGSIVSDSPQQYIHLRNKMQFTGKTSFVRKHPTDPSKNPDSDDQKEIDKSSMMLPNYSVDIGQFNSPPEQNVQLRGAVVAGVLDIRGNADINGVLLLTFKPTLGQYPLKDSQGNPVGNPALFNASLGYFGSDDGDEESLDPKDLPVDATTGQKYVGWDLPPLDGLADLGPDEEPTPAQKAAGAQIVPFYGYGRIKLRFDPEMALPDGIMVPMQVDIERLTYKETRK